MKKSLFFISAIAMMMAVSSCSSEGSKKSDTVDATDHRTESNEAKEQASEATQTDGTTQATEQQDEALSPAERNAKAGADFMAKLKNDNNVKFLPSGMAYKAIKEGNGPKPTMSNTVTVKYTGKHIDGSVFDSSGDQTIDFPLNGVIAGFSEGISNMNRGSIYELYIPSEMGYGQRGAGGAIGPNETLIFEVELVDFR